MISHLSPTLKRVSTEIRPQDLLLQKGSWCRFSDAFPDTHKWAKGKAFEVSQEPMLVPYAKSYILPETDYVNVPLDNSTAGLKLYPENEGVLYECLVGLKEGNYLVHVFFASTDYYIHHLGETSMYPVVTDANLKYLGGFKPSDTPADCPLLKLYFIKDMPAFYLKPLILEGVDFEKVSILFWINKCKLTEIKLTDEVKAKALLISWHTELKGY